MKKPIVIAELGSVHDGSIGNCINLIKCAKENGAQMIKLQHHISEEETLKNAPNPKYFKLENRYDYFKRTSFNKQEWLKIINYCKKIKIDFMCSVFSLASFKYLIKLGVKNIKVPSGELNNTHLLKNISLNKKIKVFISTGMSNWNEILNAVSILNQNKLVIFQCTSLYPCPIDYSGINIIKDFKKKFPKHEIGFSDHTTSNHACFGAVALGACILERHYTDKMNREGPDIVNSMDPEAARDLVEGSRIIKKERGGTKGPIEEEKPVIEFAYASIVTIKDIKKGEELTYDYGYDMEHFLDHPCLCGTRQCVGFIVREDQRFKVRRLLKNKKINKPQSTNQFKSQSKI